MKNKTEVENIMNDSESSEFELYMLAASYMFSMSYSNAVKAAMRELRELREADKEATNP